MGQSYATEQNTGKAIAQLLTLKMQSCRNFAGGNILPRECWSWHELINCPECGPIVIWLFQCAADIACWGYISWAPGFGIVYILQNSFENICIYIMCPRKCCTWCGLLIVQCVNIRMMAAGSSKNPCLDNFSFLLCKSYEIAERMYVWFLSTRSGLNPRPLTQIPWIYTRMGDLPSIRISVHITYHPWSSQSLWPVSEWSGCLLPSMWQPRAFHLRDIWIGAGRPACLRPFQVLITLERM